GRLTPNRVRRGFRNLHPKLPNPAGAPKPTPTRPRPPPRPPNKHPTPPPDPAPAAHPAPQTSSQPPDHPSANPTANANQPTPRVKTQVDLPGDQLLLDRRRAPAVAPSE